MRVFPAGTHQHGAMPSAERDHRPAPADLPPAVLVGVASVVGLQTARLLSAQGVRVIGIAGDRRHFAARTRACERVIEADVHGEGFLAVLEQLGPELGRKAVLVPCTDQAVMQASRHRDRLATWYHLPLADHDIVTRLADKAEFAGMARALGLPTPATRVVSDRASAEAAAAELSFPVVVKPSVKTPEWRRATSAKVCLVRDPGRLLELVDRVRHAAPCLVVQEFIDGADDGLFTCNTYFAATGLPLVTFTTRKRRQWPPALGIASYAEPSLDEGVTRAAVDLFTGSGFHGLGYLEVKRDPDGGGLLLIEANVGRPTGRSAAAEAAGVRLLWTMYCDAAGLPLPDAQERLQRPGGPVWIDMRRDAMAAWHCWRRGELGIGQWLRQVSRPKVYAVWSAADPQPFVLEVVQSLRKVLTRRLTRRSRG